MAQVPSRLVQVAEELEVEEAEVEEAGEHCHLGVLVVHMHSFEQMDHTNAYHIVTYQDLQLKL